MKINRKRFFKRIAEIFGFLAVVQKVAAKAEPQSVVIMKEMSRAEFDEKYPIHEFTTIGQWEPLRVVGIKYKAAQRTLNHIHSDLAKGVAEP